MYSAQTKTPAITTKLKKLTATVSKVKTKSTAKVLSDNRENYLESIKVIFSILLILKPSQMLKHFLYRFFRLTNNYFLFISQK